jgi:hypothetical protein
MKFYMAGLPLNVFELHAKDSYMERTCVLGLGMECSVYWKQLQDHT